jgi:hypothetical protein
MAAIRKVGLRNTLIGVGFLLLAALFYYANRNARANGLNRNAFRGIAEIIIAGIFGLWKLVKGISDLIRPQSETESITEMSD